MAKSKTASTKKSTKSTAKKKSSGKAKNTAEPMTQPPPIRRELAAVVFLFLGALCIISYFNTEGTFVVFFANLVKNTKTLKQLQEEQEAKEAEPVEIVNPRAFSTKEEKKAEIWKEWMVKRGKMDKKELKVFAIYD